MLTVSLLLIELTLVIKMPLAQTKHLRWTLDLASAARVVLGYPGEILDDFDIR